MSLERGSTVYTYLVSLSKTALDSKMVTNVSPPLVAPTHLTVVVESPPCTLTSKRAKRECGEGREGVNVRGRR